MANKAVNMLSCLAFLLVGSALNLSASGQTREIPALDRAPKIDGEVDPAEWRSALHFTDFKETSE